MSTLGNWIAVGVVGCGLAAGVVLWRNRPAPPSSAIETPAVAEVESPTTAAAPSPDSRRPPAAVPHRPPVAAPVLPSGAVKPILLEPLSPERGTAYRPARLLQFSDGLPGRDRAADDSSPILLRILRSTKVDAAQEQKIRELWHTHEDGRRVLLAHARPASIGLPRMDSEKLAQLDKSLHAGLFSDGVLTIEQRNRLMVEMFPGGIDPNVPSQ